MDGTDRNAPAVTTLDLTNIVINGRKLSERTNTFMGLDSKQILANFADLKRKKFLVTNEEAVKPYANMEIRLFYPPTMAMSEVVDYSYPARMLTRDKQFVKNMAGELINH